MKDVRFIPRFIGSIPESLARGTVYISLPHGIAVHLCACGCGHEVVTPFGGSHWALRWTSGAVTLYPSIGNGSLPCRSHYYIRYGLVRWLPGVRVDALVREEAELLEILP